MSRTHEPDPKRPPDRQDKRSVAPIELANVDQWLRGSIAEAARLVRVPPIDVFSAAPEE